MAKRDSAQRLAKRLAKIERAQGRLGDLTTRILTQAETLNDLLGVAEAFAVETAPNRAAGTARASRGVKKVASAKGPTRKSAPAARTTAAKPASRRTPAAARAATTATRRPRRTAPPA
jgi:hypothetical protein